MLAMRSNESLHRRELVRRLWGTSSKDQKLEAVLTITVKRRQVAVPQVDQRCTTQPQCVETEV